MPRYASRNERIFFHLGVGLGLSLLGTVLLWWMLSGRGGWPPWVGCWLVAINVTAFGYYGYDKGRAKSASSRVPELALHGLSFAGGSLGAYAAMRFFRHKTIKGSFRILFWGIVVLQVALILWIIKRLLMG